MDFFGYSLKHLIVGILILCSLFAFKNMAFGPKEKEKTLTTDLFWRVTHYQKKQDSGGYANYYRMYDMRNGGKIVTIGPPHLLKYTTEFNSVTHFNAGDFYYPECLVVVYEQFTNERGYGDGRLRSFWVKSVDDIKPAG